MPAIRLTPTGHLRCDLEENDPPRFQRWQETFAADWREGLFGLAADRIDTAASPSLRYWQEWAGTMLTRLCHLPEDSPPQELKIEPPSEAELGRWLLTVPPMTGGEYLNRDLLLELWAALTEWCREAVTAGGGLAAMLAHRAPKWRQVGRVCFHLAENKGHASLPFAFMATYVSGLNENGRTRHLPLGQALQHYAGSKNRPALIKLLAPVQAASERCPWVKTLVESGEIYRPAPWDPQRAYRFLRTVPELEESGLTVRLPDWWRQRPRPRVTVTIGGNKPATLGVNAVLDFDVGVALGDGRLSREEIAELLAAGDDGLVLFKGQWVEVDREKLTEAIAHWESLQKEAGRDGISFIEGMRLLAGATPDLKPESADEEERQWLQIEAGAGLGRILAGLRDPARLAAIRSGDLRATLRPYQQQGVNWLHFLTQLGLGACLADDMGLGKTMQILGLLLHKCPAPDDATATDHGDRLPDDGPALLVVPASLLGNWQAEAQRFAPGLRLAFLHPAASETAALERIAQNPAAELAGVDLAVTTYSLLPRQEWLATINWRLIIIDEAQAIKNPGTRQTRAIKKLPALARVALTGTPVENRLGDLWSLFDFLNPGLLGSNAAFKSFCKNLQARTHDQYAPLRRLVAPYILRRMKTDRSIIRDLPEKVETTCFCALSKAQVVLYQQVVESLQTALDKAEGIKRRGLILQTLLRLKQICNHPDQLTGAGAYQQEASGKFIRLGEICQELAERQERALIFTQFREIIPALAEHLAVIFGRPGLILHGQTSVAKRKGLVDQFQEDDGPPFMVLSLKAGGTGLNLTAASQVIHFDRWWNPAVEDQATDRAFRIGQRKNVLVHKFVTSGSVEEKIDAMIREKRQLANQLLGSGEEVDLTALDDRELLNLVRLDLSRASL